MNELITALARLSRDLDLIGCRWAVVGGMAIAVRAEARPTRDVDVAVAIHRDEDAESLVRSVLQRGYRSWQALEQTEVERLATMRLVSPSEGLDLIVDLLFASSGIEPEVVAGSQRMEIVSGLRVPIASTGHLIALKVLAARPHDLGDLGQLLRYADDADLRDARAALTLITERGFHREKDLLTDFERYLEMGPEGL